MKLTSKIFKTIAVLFALVFIATLYGCEMTEVPTNSLETPTFTFTTEDKTLVTYIEDTLNADGYYLYVYQDNALTGKYFVSPEKALMGFELKIKYGVYELAVQALDSTGVYTASEVSAHKYISLTEVVKPEPEPEPDPEPTVYTITYVLNGGSLGKDAPTSYKEGETVFLIDAQRSNYEFAGWYLKSDFSDEAISVLSNKTTGNVTLYAKWINNDVEYTGYYADANDLEGTNLKKALRTIISTGFKGISYGDLRYKLPITDAALDDSSKMLLLFSHHEVEAKWDSATTWNREHVWPKSKGWFNEDGAGCDIHHIRPENVSVNSIHGNLPYGEVSNGTAVKCCGEIVAYKTSSYFEPLDDFKGDVARIIFYLLVRYSQSDSYPITNVAQSLNMLLEWHESDPVDDFEIARNERSYSIQNNRNPFIDHPEFAAMIWG